MRRSSLLLAAIAFWRGAYAQCQEVVPAQFAGTPFANSLPLVNKLSHITYFKIKDPSGQHVCTTDAASDLSLLTYLSFNSSGQIMPNNAIKRLVIIVSGANSDPWNYHQDMLSALTGMADSQITTDNVAILAPYFPNDNQAGTGFPYNSSGITADQEHPSPALVWYGTDVSLHQILYIPNFAAYLLTQHCLVGRRRKQPVSASSPVSFSL
jgi:hypothetical protein